MLVNRNWMFFCAICSNRESTKWSILVLVKCNILASASDWSMRNRKVRNLYTCIFQWQCVVRRRINLSPWGRIFRVKFSGKSAFFRVVSRDASVSCVVCDFSQLVADGPISGCFGLVIKKAGPRAKLGKILKFVNVCQINKDPYRATSRSVGESHDHSVWKSEKMFI